MNKRVGYCCICLGINENKRKKDNIFVNRGMVKKTFDSKGLSYVSELALLNIQDTYKILKYNIENDIFLYRMSSDIFPWFTHYKFKDLDNISLIREELSNIGDFIKSNNIRVSFHPSQFNILSSENDVVVEKTIDELNKHAEIMDMMGLDQSNFYPINIHIGTTKPNKLESSKKFCRNFNRLSESCRKRLTVENDDSETQFSIKELYEMVYSDIGIPIVADSLHHYCNPNNTTWENALRLAVSTWNVIPVAHHSSSKKIFEDNKATVRTHADFIYERFENFDIKIDVELECKKKDLALIKYKNDFSL